MERSTKDSGNVPVDSLGDVTVAAQLSNQQVELCVGCRHTPAVGLEDQHELLRANVACSE